MLEPDGIYVSEEEHPLEITTSQYWSYGPEGSKGMILREALPAEHKENLWNWFRREYPNYNPRYYGIQKPVPEPHDYY